MRASIIKFIGSLAVLFALAACGTSAKVTKVKLRNLSNEALVSNIEGAEAQFSTFESRLKIRYEDPKRVQNLTVTLRLQKDSLIWMNASFLGISMARALITPEKFQYYEKIDKTYFEGDFSILSRWLGTELNFYQLQSLLLAEPIVPLGSTPFRAKLQENLYRVDTKDAANNWLMMLLLRPDTFKTASQQIIRRDKNQMVTAHYTAFQNVSGIIFPEKLAITATEKQERIIIDLQYDRPEINHRLNVPFTVPSGYTKLVSAE